MQEVIRTRQIEQPGPAGLGSIFDARGASPGIATVQSGAHVEPLPVGGMTVGEVRRRFRDRFDIASTSQATLDGQDVSDNTVVRAGQRLAFIRPAGEKGRGKEGWKNGRMEAQGFPAFQPSRLPIFQSVS